MEDFDSWKIPSLSLPFRKGWVNVSCSIVPVQTIVDHCGHLEQQCQSLKDQLKKVDADLSASRQLEGDANRKTRQLQAEIDLLQRQADSEAAEKDLTMKQLTSQLEKLSHSVVCP